MEQLSVRQQSILDFIKNEITLHGYPPSIREICNGCGLKSTSTAHAHLETLEKKGYIKKGQLKNRCIEICDPTFYKNKNFVDVPIVGNVSAGEPILAVENIENTFPIPAEVVGSKTVFMLKIKGNSMINVGIFNKDLVLVAQQLTAENGDIVVALVDDSATVKTFFKEKGHYRLQPENDSYDPIIVKDVKILGKVIGLFRVF